MAKVRRVGYLEINQDLRFQRRFWRIQRVGWGVMVLLALAALLGLLGPGLLSSTTLRTPNASLRIEYDRFARYQAPTQLKVHVASGSEREGVVQVWLNRDYLNEVQVTNVAPQPDSVTAGPDRLVYSFHVSRSDQPTLVIFYLEPEQFGQLSGRVGLGEQEFLNFRQFIYP